MCLLVCAIDRHPDYVYVLIANRDEYHVRPSAALDWWADVPGVAGGRDLKAGGSWFAVSTSGRFAAVTNVRQTGAAPAGRSRGELVSGWLTSPASPAERLRTIAAADSQFNGYNLLAGDAGHIFYASNRSGETPRELRPGIYGLSNHLLDTPWPKLVRAKERLERALAGAPSINGLLEVLADREPAMPDELAAMSIESAADAPVSAPFVVNQFYGTRCSTVMLWGRDGRVRVRERRYNSHGESIGDAELLIAT
jgi:uncharacterized protein with NRDE domain